MADNINCLIFFISCIILLQKYKNNLINLRNLWFILYLCTRIYSEPYKMRQLRKSFWCTLVLLTTTILPTNADNHISSKLVINELMQSNIDCIMDDLNEFPDSWVELYNASDETVFLKDYQIGTDAGDPWQLPFMTVEPKCFVLVYCDKEASGRHTDFRLETGKGCTVYLYQGGEKVDSLPAALPKMPAPNIAYGRKTDGGSEWGYQLTPTPGAANSGEVCDGDHILGEPIFSQKGYVQNGKQAFRVTLSLPEGTPDGTEIRYTTDGSEPTANSNQCPVSGIPVRKSTTVRAKLFCGGWLSPRSTVESYIFHDRSLKMPVISITIDDRYLNDANIGIFANNNDHNNPHDWRRPMTLEFFDALGEPSRLNQLCETRISGGWSRDASRKSMILYANKRFGTKTFDHEFFPDQKPGVTNFKSVVLRNAGNDRDGLYMRDAVCQRSMAVHRPIDWQAWRPAVVYINGQYHAILNIRERANEVNVLTNYGLEDIDLTENGVLKEGTMDKYNAFTRFYKEKGHTLEEYAQWIDWEEYIDIMAMNLYFCNLDFPGNNNVMWRPRTDDGRWRWIAKDVDYALGLYNHQPTHNILKQYYNANNTEYSSINFSITEASTRLFRNIMEDPDFRREMIDRLCIYMGDFLNEKGVRAIWDPMYELLRYEWDHHHDAVYGSPWWPNYNDELNNARSWLSKRTSEMYKHIGLQYDLGSPIPLTVSIETEEDASLSFNGVTLSQPTFNGKFFSGRTINLEGNSEEQSIAGWRIVETLNGSTTTREVSGAQLNIEMPACSKLAITAIAGTPDGISTIETIPDLSSGNVYDLNGRLIRQGTTSLDGLPHGIYIVGGKKVAK